MMSILLSKPMIAVIAVVITVLVMTSPPFSLRKHYEHYYLDQWCEDYDGKTEVIISAWSKCDCLTDSHAVEVSFADKWHEAIGKALHNGLQTGKEPGIALIIEKQENYKYWTQLNTIIEYFELPIETWKIQNY